MTPEDQEQLRSILREELATSEARNQEALAAAELRIQDGILRGLEGFARGNFARMHRLETSYQATNERITALEERVLYLETRRPQPPTQ